MKPINAEVATSTVVHRMAAKDYFAKEGLSHSGMKRLHPTPAHFLAPEVAEEDEVVSPALALGTLTHTLLLEPGSPLPPIAIKPKDMNFSKLEGKAWKREQEDAGKTIVTQAELDAAVEGSKAIARHPLANRFLRYGYSEVSYFDTRATPYGDVQLKARIDFVPTGADFLVDIKTAKDASEFGFAKALAERRYYSQGVFYLQMHNGLQPDDQRNEMIFLVVEKRPPYLVACYKLSADFIHLGHQMIQTDIETYARSLSDGSFEGYKEGPLELSPPPWLVKSVQRQ